MATATHPAEAGPIPVPPKDQPEQPKFTPQQASEFDQFIRHYVEESQFGWVKLADAGRAIRDNDLWKQFPPKFGEQPFTGFVDYVERTAERAKTQIYVAMKARATLDFLPSETCGKLRLGNAIWLARFAQRMDPKHVTKEIIAKGEKLSEKEFSEYINDKMPGAAKEELKQTIAFRGCDKSLAKVVDDAIKVALWEIALDENPNDDKRNALERLAIFYLDSKCEHEGFKNLSNREAYQKAHQRGAKKKPN